MPDLAAQLKALAGIGNWERPEGTKTLILEALDSPDSDLRLLALELAGEDMDDELAGEVVRLLDSGADPEVRGRAAIVLGPALEQMSDDEGWEGPDFDEPILSTSRFHEIERRLETIYRDAAAPKLVRRRALEAAVRSPRPWQEGAIRSAWASGDDEWQLTAVFCMGWVSGFKDEIVEAFGSDSPKLRREAVIAAGQMEIEEIGDELVVLAASEKTPRDLRLAAIEALGTVATPDGSEMLEMLTDSEDPEIAEIAQEALENALMFSSFENAMDEAMEEDPT